MTDHIDEKLEPLSSKWWKISVDEEYKRVHGLNGNDVQDVAYWLKTQPHLPPLNDNQIIIFLRACQLNKEKAKVLIDLHYTERTQMPYFFSSRDIYSIGLQNAMTISQIGRMPQRDPKTGSIVFVSKILPSSVSLYNADEMAKLTYMVLDSTHMTDGSAPNYIFISDTTGFTFSHLLRTSISRSADNCRYFQEVSTCVLKKYHFVRSSYIIKRLISLLKPFIRPEIFSLISFHTDDKSLLNELDPRCVPSDYGGTGPSLEEITKQTYATLTDYNDWFKQEEKLRVDEEKRPKKNNSSRR